MANVVRRALGESLPGTDLSVSRGAQFLSDMQHADGTWSKQDGATVFFRTTPLDYAPYRKYFLLHALALHEARLRGTPDQTCHRAGQAVSLAKISNIVQSAP